MKKYFFLFCVSMSILRISAQFEIDTKYDSILAKKLGADEYGMKQYYLVNLKIGPNRTHSKEEATKIQKAHLDNITKLANEGKLLVAGPFMDDWEVRGIFIFNVSSMEEAKALTLTDPAVIAGRLTMEIHPFYCSASLMMIPDLHKKVTKKEM